MRINEFLLTKADLSNVALHRSDLDDFFAVYRMTTPIESNDRAWPFTGTTGGDLIRLRDRMRLVNNE